MVFSFKKCLKIRFNLQCRNGMNQSEACQQFRASPMVHQIFHQKKNDFLYLISLAPKEKFSFSSNYRHGQLGNTKNEKLRKQRGGRPTGGSTAQCKIFTKFCLRWSSGRTSGRTSSRSSGDSIHNKLVKAARYLQFGEIFRVFSI